MRTSGRTLWVASLSLALSCAGGEPAREGAPQRIISLIPSATETIMALGAGDRLVARTDYDIDPLLAHLPTLGGGLTPSLEQLTLLDPDLVVAWPDNLSRSLSGRLGDLGITLYTPQAQSLEDVYETARELGRILDRQAAADSLNRAIRMSLAQLASETAELERPGVFYVVWHDPPTAAGPGTYIHELIEIAGGQNIFFDAPALWPQISMEEVVRRNPDILIFPHGEGPSLEVAQLQRMVGWRDLEAVRQGRVVTVDAYLFNRPGPRVVEAARRLADIIHPAPAPAPAPELR